MEYAIADLGHRLAASKSDWVSKYANISQMAPNISNPHFVHQ